MKTLTICRSLPLSFARLLPPPLLPGVRRRLLPVLLAILAGTAAARADGRFQAVLGDWLEVPPTDSGLATGYAAFSLTGTTLTVTAGFFQNLKGGATAVTINDAAVGANGPALFALTLISPGDTFGTFSGAGFLTDAQVADLEAGNVYVNITSEAFPTGEIRGQLSVVPPTINDQVPPPFINYQGRVLTNGVTFTGTGQFTFTLVDGHGNSYWSLGPTNIAVVRGLYSVQLGPLQSSLFASNALSLRVSFDDGVNGAQQFPDQLINSVGYAFVAEAANSATTAATALTVAPGGVNAAAIANGAITAPALAPGAITAAALPTNVAYLDANQVFTGQNFFTNANNSFVGSGSGLANVNAAFLGGLPPYYFWQTKGNAGTSPGLGNFLGTTDNNPLELWVNNSRAFRLEPTTGAPNVIGGATGNSAGASVGATIGGGLTNTAGSYSFVGGGQNNTAGGVDGYSTVAGGRNNTANGDLYGYATIGGGYTNTASGDGSTVGGGQGNVADGDLATVAGGALNLAAGDYAFVGGGVTNGAGPYSFVGGGEDNIASGDLFGYATVGGGYTNTANGDGSTVGGGQGNVASGDAATVGGGTLNMARGDDSFVGGGYANAASGTDAIVGGGSTNTASGDEATVPGGQNNVAAGIYSFAAGQRAKALFQGDFVWADSQPADFAATANDQFLIRATNGVGINSIPGPGVALSIGGGTINFFGGTNSAGGTNAINFNLPINFLPGAVVNFGNFAFFNAQATFNAGALFAAGPVNFNVAPNFNAGANFFNVAPVFNAGAVFNNIAPIFNAGAVFNNIAPIFNVAPNFNAGANFAGDLNFGNVNVANKVINFNGVNGGNLKFNLPVNLAGGVQINGNNINNVFWNTGGNANTVPGTGLNQNFLGTVDDQDLVLAVNGGQALRLESTTFNAAPSVPNVIGGAPQNSVIGAGSFIGGGGDIKGSGKFNFINGHGSVIAGGDNNTTGNGDFAAVGGGQNNAINNDHATVPGGLNNAANGSYSFAAGQFATAQNFGSFVWGGGGRNGAPGTAVSDTAANQFVIGADGGMWISIPTLGGNVSALNVTGTSVDGAGNGQNTPAMTVTAGAANGAKAAGPALKAAGDVAITAGTQSGNLSAAGSVTAASFTATAVPGFTGDGSGLYNLPLNAALFTGVLPVSVIPVLPVSVIPVLNPTVLPTNVAYLNFNQTFSASNTFLGVVTANNISNQFTGTFTGNGSGITNLNAARLTGIVPSNSLSGVYSAVLSLTNSGNNFSGNGAGLTQVDAALLGGLASSNYWQLGGNGVGPGQFLGSTNNQAVEIWVNNARALRLEPTAGAPNLIGGSTNNSVAAGAAGAFIGGGDSNTVVGSYSFAAGQFASATTSHSFVWSDGSTNTSSTTNNQFVVRASGGVMFLTGGAGLTVDGQPVLSGPGLVIQSNTNGAPNIIAGSTNNTVVPGVIGATIGGGSGNIMQSNANFSVIAGGVSNAVYGSFSFAGGEYASATNNNVFVWSDGSTNTSSTVSNQFLVRASGGVVFYSGTDTNTGVSLAAGSGAWSSLSDRNAKENLVTADPQAILAKVAALPVATWNYKSQTPSIRHIGPMAQDFHAAFGVGEDEKHITTIDEEGVALAAIKGLNQKLDEKDAEIQQLQQTVAQLKEAVNKLAANQNPAEAK
jgi:hypothetical protein